MCDPHHIFAQESVQSYKAIWYFSLILELFLILRYFVSRDNARLAKDI
jgi:hypothetical protein